MYNFREPASAKRRSYMAQQFHHRWSGGPTWAQALLEQKRAAVDAVDELDLGYADRERLITLLEGFTRLHLVDRQILWRSLTGAMALTMTLIVIGLNVIIVLAPGFFLWPRWLQMATGAAASFIFVQLIRGPIVWWLDRQPANRRLVTDIFAAIVEQYRSWPYMLEADLHILAGCDPIVHAHLDRYQRVLANAAKLIPLDRSAVTPIA